MAARATKLSLIMTSPYYLKQTLTNNTNLPNSLISAAITVHRHVTLISSRRSASSAASPEYDPSTTATSTQQGKTKKSHVTDKLSAVIDVVNDRKLPPQLRGQPNHVRSETDIINVVEKRIWQSMEEGHFENLPGKGKPLDLSTNPYADPAEDTLYRILSKNGCAPKWVELNKQIRTEAAEWRSALKKAWSHKDCGNNSKWIECSDALKAEMTCINNKVFRYNLVVPFGRQMCGIKWEKELDRLKES